VVFDSFDGGVSRRPVQSEKNKEAFQESVAFSLFESDLDSMFGKNEAPTLFIDDKSQIMHALHHSCDSGLGYIESVGDIDGSSVALGFNELVDAFEVILDDVGCGVSV
jgi:hypothetical protein